MGMRLLTLTTVATLLGCGIEGGGNVGGPITPVPPDPNPVLDGGSSLPPPLPPPPPAPDPTQPKQDGGTQKPPPGPDDDKDGVPNGQDKCSHTAAGASVWKQGDWAGCATGQYKDVDDGDRDGVPNGADKCPKTPIGTQVYESGSNAGCPIGSNPPPPPPPPPKDAGTPGFVLSAQEQDLLSAINSARSQNGLPAVAADAKLTCAARMHATDFAGGCDHTGSDGSWPWDRAKTCGFAQPTMTVNEICAGPGFNSGPEAVWGWKQSSGHWAALVHQQAKLVGLGVGTNGCYVALFDCCVASF